MTRELADVADAIVSQVAHDQWRRRSERYGTPRRGDDGQRSRWAIVGLGKLGRRELNYHSDLDLVFIQESEGETQGGASSISNDQFVSEVVRRVLKAARRDLRDRSPVCRRHPPPAPRRVGPRSW